MDTSACNRLLVPWLLCAALWACTSSHGAPPAGKGDGGGEGGSQSTDPDGGPPQVSELRAELLDALCERKQACAELHGFPYDDLDDCARLTDPWLMAGPSRPRVEGCIDALATMECDALALGRPAACQSLWLPRPIAQGEHCDGWVLCEPGTFCDYSGGQCGACAPLRENGEDCGSDSSCVSRRCVGKRCVERGSEGDRCQQDRDCTGFCDEGSCRDFAPEGAACERQVECASNRCDTGECVPFQVPRIGDPCETYCAASDHFVSHGTGLDCQDGKCVEAPGQGEACGTTCRVGYVCVDGICEVRPDPGTGVAGSACDWPPDCREDLICHPVDGRCRQPAGAGEGCISATMVNAGCTPEAYCEPSADWTCAERRADGEACDVHRECLSGFCLDDVCSESFCR